MEVISSCPEKKSGLKSSRPDKSLSSIDRSNKNVYFVHNGSNDFSRRNLLNLAHASRSQQTCEGHIQRSSVKMSEEIYRSSIPPMYYTTSYEMNGSFQHVKEPMSWSNKNTRTSGDSEMDWESISKNLYSIAVPENHPLGSVNCMSEFNVGDSNDQCSVLVKHNSIDDNRGFQYFYANDASNQDPEKTVCSIKNHGLDNQVTISEEGLGFYEASSSAVTSNEPGSRRVRGQGSPFRTELRGLHTKNNTVFYQNSTRNLRYQPRFASENHVEKFLPFDTTRHAEGDYLFSEDLIRKRKFRLLVDREKEIQIRAEFYPYCSGLSDMITLKYRSLGIPVEVEAYHREDKGRANVKSFNIVFLNTSDVSRAFNLVDSGELVFSLREARPSPTYHVKYKVMHPVGVFEGKCFRQEQIHELRKGDTVTANQLKGNKVRIIKWSPIGCKIEFDLFGWVLLQTKDMVMLRRVDQIEEEKVEVKSSSKSTTAKPVLRTQKILEQPRKMVQRQIVHKSNPQRVSASNFSPFKVLVEVEVRKGRKEPAIVGRLKPGSIVWANQHKGSMLRIMKMDHCGNIKMDHNLKPEVWGWVCLQRRGDEKPRLVRISSAMVAKIKVPGKGRLPREKEMNTFQKNHDRHRKHQQKMSRNNLKNCNSKIAQPSFWSRKKNNSGQLVGSVNYSAGAQTSVHVKDVLRSKLDKVAIPSSHGYSTTEIRNGCSQNEDKIVVPGMKPFEPFRINVNFPRKNSNSGRKIQPYNTTHIPGAMKCSRSVSPMSLSSPSPRPGYPGLLSQ